MKKLIIVYSVLFFNLIFLARGSYGQSPKLPSTIIPVVDRQYLVEAIKLIKETQRSISLSMFVIKQGRKVDLLLEKINKAALRGVKVRILFDDNIAHNKLTLNYMRGRKNVEIKFDSPQKTTHNKMMIVDEKAVLIGSTNWTDSSLGYANEANVIIKNEKIARYLQEYFNKLWDNSSQDISPFKDFKGDVIPLIDRQYFDAVYPAFKEAKKRIWVMVYGFKTSGEGTNRGDLLAEEMIKAKKRGVQVRLLLEKSNFNQWLNQMNLETKQYLEKDGVEVKFDRQDVITHSKVVIVDDVVFLGATNWSYGGLELWHNSDVLIKDKKILDFFVGYFERKF